MYIISTLMVKYLNSADREQVGNDIAGSGVPGIQILSCDPLNIEGQVPCYLIRVEHSSPDQLRELIRALKFIRHVNEVSEVAAV